MNSAYKYVLSICLLSVSSLSNASMLCECPTYIKHRLGDTVNTTSGNAKDMGAYLEKKGYKVIDSVKVAPTNKDIMIILPSYQHGYNAEYGHVGIVSSATVQKDGSIHVDMVSTNMHPGESSPAKDERSEYMCDNVSNKTVVIAPKEIKSVVFYRK